MTLPIKIVIVLRRYLHRFIREGAFRGDQADARLNLSISTNETEAVDAFVQRNKIKIDRKRTQNLTSRSWSFTTSLSFVRDSKINLRIFR